MTITQTIDIPADRQITVPREVPEGRANIIIKFPVQETSIEKTPLPGGTYRTVEEALEASAKKYADPNRKPISRLFGALSKNTFGDPVAYQRAIRDEWD